MRAEPRSPVRFSAAFPVAAQPPAELFYAQSAHLSATGGMTLPGSFIHILSTTDFALLALAMLAIAIAGALGPTTCVAAAKTTIALHAE